MRYLLLSLFVITFLSCKKERVLTLEEETPSIAFNEWFERENIESTSLLRFTSNSTIETTDLEMFPFEQIDSHRVQWIAEDSLKIFDVYFFNGSDSIVHVYTHKISFSDSVYDFAFYNSKAEFITYLNNDTVDYWASSNQPIQTFKYYNF